MGTIYPSFLEIKRCLLLLLHHHIPASNSLTLLKPIHSKCLRLHLHHDNYLLNIMLKCVSFDSAHLSYARLLFSHTHHPNLLLYNTMIRAFVSHSCYAEALHLYSPMRTRHLLLPDHFTFPFLLKACTRIPDFSFSLKLHGLIVKLALDSDVFVNTALVCLYSKARYLVASLKLFDEIPYKNVVSWTALISGFIDAGQFSKVLDVFRRMLEMNLRPDSFTLVRVLSACTQLGDWRSREWIHRYVREIDMERNVFVGASLVDMYAKCGDMDRARGVFDRMPEKDIVTWSTIIQGYASNGMPKQVVDVFFRMQEANVKPDCFSMVGLLSACASLGALKLGRQASELMNMNEVSSNPILGTALIDMFAKCGNITSALKVFEGMVERDVVVWNAMISGLAMNGHVKAAFTLFGKMEKFGSRPDGNTFIGLLCGCTHAGLVEDGRRFFNSMSRVFFLIPSVEHYGCLVDLLCRAGSLVEAHEFITSMPMEANAIVWGAMLGGCKMYKNAEIAECALKRLIELEPWNSGNYVQLSNIYSATNRWADAAEIRLLMKEGRIQKPPAYSWIEIDGVVHEFLVGDKSHPFSDKIYTKLDELMKKLGEAGYAPTTEFVLFDIEEEEKQHSLGHHSEKLAVAFALLTLPPTQVIRVMKNLRVCGDCHEFMKLVSRITGREIIIRDNNRFHSFVEGSCSCLDYWSNQTYSDFDSLSSFPNLLYIVQSKALMRKHEINEVQSKALMRKHEINDKG